MLLTGHQPNYLPYPGFFHKIASADQFLVVDTTQFVKRGPFGWIHRNRIRTSNGPQWLSLPVLHKGKYHQTIRETALNPKVNWQHKHWRGIELNYGKSPGWTLYADGLREIYRDDWSHLAPLCTKIIRWFLDVLEIDVPVKLASELAAQGKSTDYIIAFCQELGADAYLSGTHGQDYLERDLFAAANVELRFQEYAPPHYRGGPLGEIVENLSMLDMLFWCGPDAVDWVHAEKVAIP